MRTGLVRGRAAAALRWVGALVFLAGISGDVPAALALCAPDNPAAGGTVTCSGVDPNGFTDGDINLTVNIENGAQVNNPAGTGIFLSGNGGNITNNGSVTVTNGLGLRIINLGAITNNGTVTTVNGDGIAGDTGNTLINNGTVSTTGNNSEGVRGDTNITIINRGLVTTNGNAAEALSAGGDDNTIINSGTARTSGTGSAAAQGGDGTTFFNSGQLFALDPSSNVIDGNDNSRITNSGLIQAASTASLAIRLDGGTNELTLNPGSKIIGGIDLGDETSTVNVGNGLSISNTFVTAGFSNAPNIGDTNGAPFAVNGNQIAVVDPTNLAAQDELLVDLTGGIFSTVQNRLGSLRGGVAGVTTNPRPMSVGASGSSKYSAQVQDRTRQGWAQAFGSYRLQRKDGPAVDADIRLGGLVSGFDGVTGAGARLGVFFGGSQAQVEADFNSQDTDADSLFGGVYASWLRGSTAIDFALTVGYSDYDRSRRVANNLVATGIETARADYEGWFISPELTLTRPMWQEARRFEKSLTLRYSGLFLDGFTESGTVAPLSVNDRDIHVLQARTQLTMPNERTNADGSTRRNALYIGLEGRVQVGDEDVTGTLLAQNITFNPGGDDAVAGVFGGLEFERTSAGGTTFFASVEGQVETGGGRQASGKAGVKFRF